VDGYPQSPTALEINSIKRGHQKEKFQNLNFLIFYPILLQFFAK
jgi:hypothetical protein